MALTNSDARVVFETTSFDGPSSLDPILDGPDDLIMVTGPASLRNSSSAEIRYWNTSSTWAGKMKISEIMDMLLRYDVIAIVVNMFTLGLWR